MARCRRSLLLISLLACVTLATATACLSDEPVGSPLESIIPVPTASLPTPTAVLPVPTLTPESTVTAVAANGAAVWYAEMYDLSIEEALRRLNLQEEAGPLDSRLAASEPEHFGGLIIEHTPEFVFTIFMKAGGEDRVAQYLTDLSDPSIVRIVTVAYSYAELVQHQQEATEIAEQLGINAASGANLHDQVVDLYVTDAAKFEQQRAAAGLTLPPTVRVVEVPTLETDQPDDDPNAMPTVGMTLNTATPEETPALDIIVPTQPRGGGNDDAAVSGTLTLTGRCLWIVPGLLYGGYVIIWPEGTHVTVLDGHISVVKPNGDVFARVGDVITLGGGEWGGPSVEGCGGPAWGADF